MSFLPPCTAEHHYIGYIHEYWNAGILQERGRDFFTTNGSLLRRHCTLLICLPCLCSPFAVPRGQQKENSGIVLKGEPAYYFVSRLFLVVLLILYLQGVKQEWILDYLQNPQHFYFNNIKKKHTITLPKPSMQTITLYRLTSLRGK